MTSYKLMTLNLKASTKEEIFAKGRAASIREVIHFYDPDLIGVQELMDFMIPHLDDLYDKYTIYGKHRGSVLSNERCCILFKKNRFEFVKGKTIWLTDTPDKESSRVFGSIFPRIATIAILKDKKTGKTFTMCNTHLDHLFPFVRKKQATCLLKQLSDYAEGEFLLVTGDFNTPVGSGAIQKVLDYHKIPLRDVVPDNHGSTMRGLLSNHAHSHKPIDHIFLSDNLVHESTEIITSLFMGVYPSDHRPVLAKFTYSD